MKKLRTSVFSIEKIVVLSVAASARKCHALTLPFATVPDVTAAVNVLKAQGIATPLQLVPSHLAVSHTCWAVQDGLREVFLVLSV